MAKDSDLKQPPEGGGSYGSYGGYGGYSAGYGYGEESGAGGASVRRNLQDYLLVLRERIWYVVVVFLVVFSSALVFTLSETKLYRAVATVQMLRSDPNVVKVQQVNENDIRSNEDLNTQIKLLESLALARLVSERITGDDRRQFLAPYEGADASSIAGILLGNRSIQLTRMTLVLQIGYRHPDRIVAAKVANLYADVYLNYNTNQRLKDATDAVRSLEEPLAAQDAKVKALRQELLVMTENNANVSLESNRDVVGASLQTANQKFDDTLYTLSSIETRLNQVKRFRESGTSLTDLPFIASQPIISSLLQRISDTKVQIAALEQRYKAKHPSMRTVTETLAESQARLRAEVENAYRQLEADYQAALQNHKNAKEELDKKTAASIDLSRAAVDYARKDRELRTEEQILSEIIRRKTDMMVVSTIATQNARLVDAATPPSERNPEYPKVSFNLGLGLVGGLGLGLAFAFFVAYIDDRVKSSFDIEGVVGLPLIGIIPQIKRMDQADKAQIVLNNADRQVAEAFLTLHSSLRLKDESKNAKVILTTSTIPGEGKSFTTTNLALTFAAHGEKVAIVDCDLRKPNIHKSFRMENLKGVIDVCSGKMTIEEVVIKGPHANVDVIPAGGRAKNPTQILNSKGFELMVSDLRKKYDRVFIDTPPLAAVSDALIILPLVDGSIFTIYFNKVRRKAAQFAAKRLTDANVPNFGAVLNGLNLAVSGYYYAQYYDKSYKDYYVVMAKDDETSKER